MTTSTTHNQAYSGSEFLPASKEEWHSRIDSLVTLMRNPHIAPCRAVLYATRPGRLDMACIDGLINQNAYQGGVPIIWDSWEDPQTDHQINWYAWLPDRPQPSHLEYHQERELHAAVPEAFIYHGFRIVDTRTEVDALDCHPTFIREVINRRHNTSFGCIPTTKFNDHIFSSGLANPLHLMADILEHLKDRPHSSIWHNSISLLE